MRKNIPIVLFLVIFLGGCMEKSFREGVIVAGGRYIPAKTLNKGKEIYTEYCMACHGQKGDGQGIAAKGMKVPPRDFRSGIIKFGDVLAGELPHDQAIHKTLKEGLAGTAMLPWDLSPDQMDAVWQYIKTFSPKTWIGKDKKLGKKVTLAPDPFGLARKSSAIMKGKKVYHMVANCQSCHRAYATHAELNQMSLKVHEETMTEFEKDLYQTKPQESEFNALTIPPDFTWDLVRSTRNVNDLAYRIANGVSGTTMPAWKDTIDDIEIWAVAYYVQHLMDMRNTPDRKNLMERLKNNL